MSPITRLRIKFPLSLVNTTIVTNNSPYSIIKAVLWLLKRAIRLILHVLQLMMVKKDLTVLTDLFNSQWSQHFPSFQRGVFGSILIFSLWFSCEHVVDLFQLRVRHQNLAHGSFLWLSWDFNVSLFIGKGLRRLVNICDLNGLRLLIYEIFLVSLFNKSVDFLSQLHVSLLQNSVWLLLV